MRGEKGISHSPCSLKHVSHVTALAFPLLQKWDILCLFPIKTGCGQMFSDVCDRMPVKNSPVAAVVSAAAPVVAFLSQTRQAAPGS